MIDVDKTIYISLIDKIRKLRYQAQDNPQDFKSILRLIFKNSNLGLYRFFFIISLHFHISPNSYLSSYRK